MTIFFCQLRIYASANTIAQRSCKFSLPRLSAHTRHAVFMTDLLNFWLIPKAHKRYSMHRGKYQGMKPHTGNKRNPVKARRH